MEHGAESREKRRILECGYRARAGRLPFGRPARLIARTILLTVATVGFPRAFSSRDRVSTRMPARRATSACVRPAARRWRRRSLAIHTVAYAIASTYQRRPTRI